MLVRHCGARFFSLPLPGSSVMIQDFINAAQAIATATDLKGVRHALTSTSLDAQTMLCFITYPLTCTST